MYCTFCGQQIADGAAVCPACGRALPPAPAATAAAPARLEDDVAMRMLLPVGRSGLAIAAGYAGLFAFLVIFAPVALVLGVLALRDLSKHPEKRGRGRAWFGLITGALGTLLLAAVLVSIAAGG